MRPVVNRLLKILFLVGVSLTFISCSQSPEPADIQDLVGSEANSRLDLPMGFTDLMCPYGPCQTPSGDFCTSLPEVSMSMDLKYLGTLQSGQTILAFEIPIAFISEEYQALVTVGETNHGFSCARSTQSEKLLECVGPALPPEAKGQLSVQLDTEEAALFNLEVVAPELHNALLLPQGSSLEDSWAKLYECLDDPSSPDCVVLEEQIFPHAHTQDFEFYEDSTPGLVLFWSVANVIPEPYFAPIYPFAYLETLAEQMPENCLLDIRPLANACAPLVYSPLEVNEITALEDVIVVLQQAWDVLGTVYHYVFEVGDYRPATGETFDPPLDPENWTYDQLQMYYYRQIYSWLDDENIAECLDFMIQGRACSESHGWDYRLGDPEPDCATEEVVEVVNACLADSDMTGFISPVEIGDTEAMVEAMAFFDGGMVYDPWWLFELWADTPHLYDLWYPCTPAESLECLMDWFRYQEEQEVNSMLASSLPPECDPEFPESLWCQGMDDEDPTTELAQTCAQEIGWTGPLDTDMHRGLLTQAVALGLPWVEDLGQFPSCLELYADTAADFIRYAGMPLQSPAVCTSMSGTTGQLTFDAYFSMPASRVGGEGGEDEQPGDVCFVYLPPDSDPCWVWNTELCTWQCVN